MNNRFSVDFGNPLQDAFPQFLPGVHPDLFQERARHLAKQRFYYVQPGTVGRREDVFEPVGTSGQISPRLLRGVGGVIVQNQPDRGVGWIMGMQFLD